jgi:hypothetical protein
MTGIFDGIGILIIIALFFLITTPLTSVLLIKELKIFSHLSGILQKVIIPFVFLVFMVLSLFIIRTFPHSYFYGFLVYNIILMTIWVISKNKKINSKIEH